jgi:hypothetical protein
MLCSLMIRVSGYGGNVWCVALFCGRQMSICARLHVSGVALTKPRCAQRAFCTTLKKMSRASASSFNFQRGWGLAAASRSVPFNEGSARSVAKYKPGTQQAGASTAVYGLASSKDSAGKGPDVSKTSLSGRQLWKHNVKVCAGLKYDTWFHNHELQLVSMSMRSSSSVLHFSICRRSLCTLMWVLNFE